MSEGKDLTKGNLLNNMVKFCFPLLITNLLNSIYNIIDGIWIGRLIGNSGLSATTNCWPIILISYAFMRGITIITSIIVSQYFSSKDRNKIKEVITPLYIISLIIGIFTAILLISTENFWFNLFNTPIEVISDAKKYITIYLIGQVFNFIGITIISAIRAIGNSKTPLIILAITEVVNIILDPIFIKLGFGVRGAAIATSLSMIFSLILSYLYIRNSELLKFNKKYIKFNKKFLKGVSILGIPIIIQQIFTIFTCILEVNISNSLGIVGGSTYGIVCKFNEIVWVIGESINTMMTVVVGQFIGKNEFDKIKDIMKNGITIIAFPILLIVLFIIFYSEIYIRIFTNNNEVITLSLYYMHIVGIGFSLIPLYQLLYGFVLGIGNTKLTFFTSILSTITEYVFVLTLNNITKNAFLSLGIGIIMWYIAEIMVYTIYYFSKRFNKENLIREG